jgi:Ca-activated chloride channel family protein
MVGYSRRPISGDPLFVIPLALMLACLIVAALFWQLKWGRPNIAVSIAVDLSGSTYNGDTANFNAPNTVMAKEIGAINTYLTQNAALRSRPHQVEIFGFGGQVAKLANRSSNSSQVLQEMNNQLSQPDFVNKIDPDNNNVGQAVDLMFESFQSLDQKICKQVLVVTDGVIKPEEAIDPPLIAQAQSQKIPINTIIINDNLQNPSLDEKKRLELLRQASQDTGGEFSTNPASELEDLFKTQFFDRFNNNLPWVITWLGLAWICLMWVLVLPLDRWLFQGIMKMKMSLAGFLALGWAGFWTAVTPPLGYLLWDYLKVAQNIPTC